MNTLILIFQALTQAVSSGERDKVESLLGEGADLNPSPSVVYCLLLCYGLMIACISMTQFKVTPLMEASSSRGSYKIACLLLDKGADPNLGNNVSTLTSENIEWSGKVIGLGVSV